MQLPDFSQLTICPAELLDDPGEIARSLLEAARSARLGIFVWEIHRQRLIWNEAMFQVYGLPADTAIDGNAWLALLHPDDLPFVRDEVVAALSGIRPYETTFRVRGPDGGWRHVKASGWVEFSPEGRPLCMAGVNQDIHESQRFNMLVERIQADTVSAVGVTYLGALMDSLCRVLSVRRALVAEYFPIKAPRHAMTVAYSDSGEASAPLTFPLDDTPSKEVLKGEVVFYADELQQRYPAHPLVTEMGARSYMGVPLRASDGTVLGVLAIIDNKPCHQGELQGKLLNLFAGRCAAELERLRREADIQRLNGELEARVVARTEHVKRTMRELEAFTYTVSHDLNAPLRAVHGFGSILREDYGARLDATGMDYLERTLNAAERMGRLLDDLVSLSRISLRPLNIGKVDLSLLAAEIVDDLQDQYPRPGMQVMIAPHLQIHADSGLMRILLDCLLRNAWHFTAPLAEPRIGLFERERRGRREFGIVDNGTGFDAATAERLFAPFQDAQGAGRLAGSGTGLAIAQRVMHRHHGGILSESQPGEGSSFIFWLPPAAELMSLISGEDHH
ncbi:sensor histidine kinase [Chitinimonas naiadis]